MIPLISNYFFYIYIFRSVDNIINSLVPLIKKFAPEWNPNIKVLKRGFRPNPTGKVSF